MKILLANLTNGALSGGYHKYLSNIIPLLLVNDDVTHVDVFVPPKSIKLRFGDKIHWFSWPANDYKKGFPWMKTKIKKIAPDVVFVPTSRWVDCGHIPVVTMLRNMEPLIVPFGGNPWKEMIKNIARSYMARKNCNRSTFIIATSQYVKNFLHKKWNIELGKIATVYHGVEWPNAQETIPVPSFFKNENYGQFFFTAGSIRPARGLEDIIHALGMLHIKGIDYKLVIAGGADPVMANYKKRLEKISVNLGVSSQIIWAGRLSSSEMSWCYYNCNAFIMTSRVEACPNIALEAMVHECICISNDNQPMSEIFGDVAIYYPSKNGKALAEVIKTVLAWDKAQRNAMSKKAKKRAAEFSWDICAEKTIEVLARAVKNSKMNRDNANE